MLKLLLDEHISPSVATSLRRRNRALVIHALVEWNNGSPLGQDDATCLRHASQHRLALVTYDRRTISPRLKSWAEQGIHHAGVIFVDEKTISPADIGGLIRVLALLAKEATAWDCTDRICFLRR